MTDDEALGRVHHDPDFVNARRFDYDVSKLEARYPDGCPDNIIANVLMVTEEELVAEMDKIVRVLREEMGVELS